MKIPKMTKAQLEKLLNEELTETQQPDVYLTKDGLKVLHKSYVSVQGNSIREWFGNRPWQMGDQVKLSFTSAKDSKEAREALKESRRLNEAMVAYKKVIAERSKEPTTMYIDMMTGKLHSGGKRLPSGNRIGKLPK